MPCAPLPPALPPQRGERAHQSISQLLQSPEGPGQEQGDQVPALALTSCVTLGRSLDLSEPQLHSSQLRLPCFLTVDLQGTVK